MTVPDDVPGKLLHLRLPGRVPAEDEPGGELVGPDEDRPGTELEPAPEVLEGEIVEDPPAPEVRPIPVWSQRLPAPIQRAAASHTAGHGYVAAAGVASWAGRAWDSATLGTYRRQIRAAEQTGDSVGLALWLERRETAVAKRHERILQAPKVTGAVIGAALLTVVGMICVVVLLGVLATVTHVASFEGFVGGVLTAVGVLLRLILAAAVLAIVGGPVAFAVLAWREGRRAGRAPAWMATSSDADVDIEIDESTIAEALRALRIPVISEYLKAGTPLQFITPARRDGRGTHAVVRLPKGVSAEKVSLRRADLATGLYRQAKEVWPKTGAEAGILDLWIADKGALAEGAGPYPLLEDGAVDVFKGVPGGKTLRGDPVDAPVMGRNTIVGGAPEQGKSSAARVIMTGVALDPTAELRIWIPDTNFDFQPFKPRCSRFVMGAEDERIAEILDDLRELAAEVQRRGKLLVQFEVPEVNRKIASAGVGLHPLVCLLEEAHLALGHKEYGKEISELVIYIVKLGRKRGIHMIVSTQAPTKEGDIPRDITRNCTNGICFYVGDYVPNDAILGQGAYRAGHRATDLMAGVDRGTSVAKGFSGERSETIQWHFLSVKGDHDQVSPIIARSIAAIEAAGRTMPRPGPAERRDLLTDVAAVLPGDEHVPVADLPQRLRQLAPSWLPYQRMKGNQLRALLDSECGYRVPTTGNRFPVNPAMIRALLADRAAQDAQDGE